MSPAWAWFLLSGVRSTISMKPWSPAPVESQRSDTLGQPRTRVCVQGKYRMRTSIMMPSGSVARRDLRSRVAVRPFTTLAWSCRSGNRAESASSWERPWEMPPRSSVTGRSSVAIPTIRPRRRTSACGSGIFRTGWPTPLVPRALDISSQRLVPQGTMQSPGPSISSALAPRTSWWRSEPIRLGMWTCLASPASCSKHRSVANHSIDIARAPFSPRVRERWCSRLCPAPRNAGQTSSPRYWGVA